MLEPNGTEFQGIIESQIYKNDDSGWGAMRIRVDSREYPRVPRDNNGLTTIVGDLSCIGVGMRLTVNGVVKRHNKFGMQVEVGDVLVMEPGSLTEIRMMLASKMFNIGERRSQWIVDKFGDDTLRVLDEEPERLIEVEGIGKKLAKNIGDGWQKMRHLAPMLRFAANCGISTRIALKLLDHPKYGKVAEAKVREDPWALARHFSGVGFKTADEIAKRLGVPEISNQRFRAVAFHMLDEAAGTNGDCFLYQDELTHKTLEFLDDPRVSLMMINDALQEAYDEAVLILDEPRVYQPRVYHAENQAAEFIYSLCRTAMPERLGSEAGVEKAIQDASANSDIEPHAKQLLALRTSLSSKVSVITGGPGTGKTTVTRMLVHALEAAGLPVMLMAPTGRASKRMASVIGRKAYTIHSRLFRNRIAIQAGEPMVDVQWRGAIVIDEASMIDLRLFHELLQNVHPTAMLVFIGDIDQLPAVGAGAVLRDLINCEMVASTQLTHIYRQGEGSDIISTAHAINAGDMPKLKILQPNLPVPETDCYTATHEDAKGLGDLAVYFATQFAGWLGFDPRYDVQVIAPTRKGEAGVWELNTRLQQAINPSPPVWMEYKDQRWGLGDRLMVTKNLHEIGVTNGELGHIASIEFRNGKPVNLVLNVDGTEYEIPRDNFYDCDLAYATTIHKVQGSEFPFVVMTLHTGHWTMLQRNLVYTAVTRSKKKLAMCIHPDAFSRAIGNNVVTRRNSMLGCRIDEHAPEGVAA